MIPILCLKLGEDLFVLKIKTIVLSKPGKRKLFYLENQSWAILRYEIVVSSLRRNGNHGMEMYLLANNQKITDSSKYSLNAVVSG